MEVNPHAIRLDDDEYTVMRPARGDPPPAGSHRQVVPMNSSSDLIENPHAISLKDNDYPSSSAHGPADEYGQVARAPRDKKEGKMTKKVCTAKLFMCAFAIGFLWLTTFDAAQSFVNAVIQSNVTPQDVLQGWNATFHESRIVKGNFETCVEAKNFVCLEELNVTTLNELQRGIDIQTESEATIAAAQAKLAKCQEKVSKKHQILKFWMDEISKKTGQSWLTTANCRNGTLFGDFMKISDGNTTQNADAQARSLTQQYQAALGEMAASTRSAFDARLRYNAEWASGHTPNLLDKLAFNATKINVPNFTLASALATLSGPELQGLKDIKDSLGPKMNDTWNDLVINYATAKSQAELMQQRANEYQVKFSAAAANMSQYVEDTQHWLLDAKETMNKFAPSGCGICDVLPAVDVSEPNFPGSLTLPQLDIPGFNISTEQWDANLANKLSAYKAASQAKADAANAQMKAFFANLDTKPEWFDCIACDYNPPPLLFPSSGEQEESDSNFNNQLQGLLTNLGDAATGAQLGASKMNNETIELPSLEFVQAQRSKAELKFAELSGDPDFSNILAGFATISTLLLAIDYLYRAFRSVSLFVRYWFGSAVGLPDIKIEKQKSVQAVEPIGVRIMTFVTSPPFVLTIVGFLIFGIIYILMDLYVPIVNEYVDGCASPDKENGPGTLISRNAYSLVFNNAVGSGQKDMQKHLTDYDTLRQQICGQYVTQTGNTQDQLRTILTATLKAYQTTYEELQVMDKCMDVSTNNFNFNNLTSFDGVHIYDIPPAQIIPFTLTEGPQGSPIQLWKEDAVKCAENELANYSYLEDMTFICGNVSLCTHMSECTAAIDTAVLKRGTWKSSCESEKIVLVGISAAGFSIFVYIMWNLGRIFLVMGLGRLLWKHLVPHGFNYVATCTTDGRIARDTEKEVTAKLASTISTFERWGMVYLGFAVFLQLVWIIPIAVFSSEIASIGT